MLNDEPSTYTALFSDDPLLVKDALLGRMREFAKALIEAIDQVDTDAETAGIIPEIARRVVSLNHVVEQICGDEQRAALEDDERRRREVASLELPRKTAEALNAAGVDLAVLMESSDDELMRIRGLGRGRIAKIRRALKEAQA